MFQKMSIRRREAWTALFVTLSAVSVGGLCGELKDVTDGWFKGDPSKKPFLTGSLVMSVIFLVLLSTFAFVIYQLKAWQTLRNRMPASATPQPSRCLVLFLSKLPERGPFVKGLPSYLTFFEPPSLHTDITRLTEEKEKDHTRRWPWEQTLRAIRLHADSSTLRHLVMVCSEESCRQAAWFYRFLTRYQSQELRHVTFHLLIKTQDGLGQLTRCPEEDKAWESIQQPARHWDFEDFDGLTLAMRALLENAAKLQLRDRDITIDFTGGQKVTSVVAAAVTFNREVQAQYVQTEKPYDVKGYDLDVAVSNFEL